MNLSQLSDADTARTAQEVALQRAENLAILGARSVMELCVGPSLRVLEESYAKHGITVFGNDIDRRWRDYHPRGRWVIGDALAVDWSQHDAVVFAPPLTKGCSGKREDALRISEVFPRYHDFLSVPYRGIRVMVLPARAMATSADRREMHDLIGDRIVDVVPLTSGRRKIRKYVDIYIVDASPQSEAAQIGDIDRPRVPWSATCRHA